MSVQTVFLKTITPKRYLLIIFVVCAVVCGLFAAVNYTANDFGLWRHRDQARIWAFEKTSKYLLAHRYVPENFDGILIGPSLSANMDTRLLHGYKIYNLSMAGGNMTELSAAANKFFDGSRHPKILMICLSPYSTINSGMKSFQINDKEYYGSLFSIIPAVVWLKKIDFRLRRHPDVFHDSAWGLNDMNANPAMPSLAQWAEEDKRTLAALRRGKPPSANLLHDTDIDPGAYRQLEELLARARKADTRIVAYYYPILESIQEQLEFTGGWAEYKTKISALFQPGEIVLDMSGEEYKPFREDISNYRDPTHLSRQGVAGVSSHINDSMLKTGMK